MKKNRDGFVLVTVLSVVALGVLLFVLYQFGVFGGKAESTYVITEPVKKGKIRVTVTEDGTLESAANVEVKCQVAGGGSILWIVKDGTMVKEGEKIVELDDSALKDQIIAQQNTLENAKATKIQAENDFNVAKISVKEYEQGTFKKELQDAETQVTIALENLRNAQNSLEHSQKMFRKGYLSKLELESQEFAVKRSQLELDSAKSAKEVLEKFTKAKQLEDLKSKVATAEAKMNSAVRSFELEESKLKKLNDQKENCVIYAPQAGMVVYANSKSRWGQQTATIEEGATVRERQAIIKLPDLSRMQVNVKVHESKVELLEGDLYADVKVQGKRLGGKVTFVANQPEQTSFMAAKVQEYSTIIAIDGEQTGLKPGMTAEVEIEVAEEDNVLMVPVAAIVQQSGKFYCWIQKNGSFERRELKLGISDDNFVAIKDGVVEGEDVVLNPRATIEEARGDGEEGSEDEESEARREKAKAKMEKSKGKGDSSKKSNGKKSYGKGGKSGGRPSGGFGNFDPSAIFKQADKNGDGKLEGDEISDRMKGRIDSYDKNKDGAVSKKEFTDAMSAFMKRMKSGGGGGGQR